MVTVETTGEHEGIRKMERRPVYFEPKTIAIILGILSFAGGVLGLFIAAKVDPVVAALGHHIDVQNQINEQLKETDVRQEGEIRDAKEERKTLTAIIHRVDTNVQVIGASVGAKRKMKK